MVMMVMVMVMMMIAMVMVLVMVIHQQKTFPSGRNRSIRVDALRQSRQRNPDGGLLHAQRQCQASRCILPSEPYFAVSFHSVGLLIQTNSLAW
jgi:hypothetical protein